MHNRQVILTEHFMYFVFETIEFLYNIFITIKPNMNTNKI